jgi:hypothetical protein
MLKPSFGGQLADNATKRMTGLANTVGTQRLKVIDTANSVLVVLVSGIQVNA